MKRTNRDILRLKDILQSISLIEGYVRGIEEVHFVNNEMMQSACLRHLEIIGEASSRLGEELKKKAHTNIPWAKIVGLRNIVAHEYFRVDVEEIWATIQSDLPGFKEQVLSILDALKEDGK